MRKSRIAAAAAGATAVGLASLAVGIPAYAHGAHSPEHGPARDRTISGTVDSVVTGSFTLTTHGGTIKTVDTDTATTYRESGDPSAISGISDGEKVVVQLARRHFSGEAPTTTTSSTLGSDATPPSPPLARQVDVILASVRGTVSDINGSTIVLTDAKGNTVDVVTSGSTLYYQDGTPVSGVSDGQKVAAYGSKDSSTSSLDALFVDVAGKNKPGPTPAVQASYQAALTAFLNAQHAKQPGAAPATTTGSNTTPSNTGSWSYSSAKYHTDSTETTNNGHNVYGVVQSVGTDSVTGDTDIVISDPRTSSVTNTVLVTSATQYYWLTCQSRSGASTQSASLSDVTAGESIDAYGTTTSAAGQLIATNVYLGHAGSGPGHPGPKAYPANGQGPAPANQSFGPGANTTPSSQTQTGPGNSAGPSNPGQPGGPGNFGGPGKGGPGNGGPGNSGPYGAGHHGGHH